MKTLGLIGIGFISLIVTSCFPNSDSKSLEPHCESLCLKPTAYFKLDGNAKDAVGKFHGTIHGNPTASANRYGEENSALAFGQNNYISIPKIGLSGDISVCGWFKIIGEHHPNHMVFLGQATGYSNRWQIIGSRNELTYYDRKGTDNTPYQLSRQQNLNEWYSLCAISSADFADNKKVKIYLNGFLAGEVSSRHITEIDADFNIGRFYNEGGWDFSDGVMDDIAIFDRILTAEEIFSIHTAGISL